MIKSIQIKNFKSITDLKLDLGTFNILIGENGCGKSNILEAMAFGAAASADKLDYEFLGSRGIRVTNPEFMISAFSNGRKKKSIEINYTTDKRQYDFDLVNDPNNPKKWANKKRDSELKKIQSFFNAILLEEDIEKKKKVLEKFQEDEAPLTLLSEIFKPFKKEDDFKEFIRNIYPKIFENTFSNPKISDFIIYSPEESSLRKFEETTQIYPLGVKGEGIFQYLKELAFDKKNNKTLQEIKQNLQLLDWFESFELPGNLLKNEYALKIKDKYLNPTLQFFDQRSTNEGFLFLLFYSTLFITKATPSFFAIDNIDASFNPKLCMKLTKNLSTLSKKYKKQVVITTQNPAILDGLNLKDEDQRLFVVSRNEKGHTRIERIYYNEKRSMRLSEIWTKGFIGGLPENF